jgi:hypothetical protein
VSALLKMNVSPRAALATIVLAACVSLVAAGREARAPAPPGAQAPARAAAERAAPHESPLDLDKLERPGLGEPHANLFAPPRAAPAARAMRPAPAPPRAPVAPPLPFRYLGKYVEGGRSAVYLARGDEPLLAAPGAALGAGYRVEEIAPDAVTLLYVPLGTRQRLPIPTSD